MTDIESNVEDRGLVTRRLEIKVPSEHVTRAIDQAYDRIVLNTRPEGRGDFEEAELSDTSSGRAEPVFTARLVQVKSTTEYFASAEGAESRRHVITVVDRPIVRSFRLSVTPPAYTRLPQKGLDENVGDVSALPGSTVRVELTGGKPLAAAQIVFHDSVTVAMAGSGETATGSFRVRGTDRYRFRLENDEGHTNPDPITYDVRPIPDEYPMVEITSPGKNIDIAENTTLALALKIRSTIRFGRCTSWIGATMSHFNHPLIVVATWLTLLSVIAGVILIPYRIRFGAPRAKS